MKRINEIILFTIVCTILGFIVIYWLIDNIIAWIAVINYMNAECAAQLDSIVLPLD